MSGWRPIVVSVTKDYVVWVDSDVEITEEVAWSLIDFGDDVDARIEAHDADPSELRRYAEEFEWDRPEGG